MNLTDFCEYGPLRDAFKALHDADCRKEFSTPPMIVPSVPGNHPGFVGMAFDYLARFSILARAPEETVWRPDYVSVSALKNLRLFCEPKRARKLVRRIADAVEEIGEIEWKPENYARASEIAQDFANLEYLYRAPKGFNPAFVPATALTAELVALLEAFERTPGMLPKRIAILNPTFRQSHVALRADADLVVDGTLIDFKVVSDPRHKLLDYVLQISGYAVLQRLGGIQLDADNEYRKPFARMGLYFARHGKLVTWAMSDIFKAAAFSQFEKKFVEEHGHWSRGHGR